VRSVLHTITRPALRHQLILQANLIGSDEPLAADALRQLVELVPPDPPSGRARLICLGFSARFFNGPLTPERDRSRIATRFARGLTVPADLGRMNVRGDNLFPELRDDEALRNKESDIILLCEANVRSEIDGAVSRIEALSADGRLTLAAIHRGFKGSEERKLLGITDGISNMQDLADDSPEQFARFVVVHDGLAGSDSYDGGTYLVFRKYRFDFQRWWSPAFSVTDRHCRYVSGEAAREMTIGRSATDDRVVENQTGAHLPAARDEAQAVWAPPESHIRQANPRGEGETSFGTPVSVPSARIFRRGSVFGDVLGKPMNEVGYQFVAFQADIRRRGFEFIHNEWLMSEFFGCRDRLLDPDSGLVFPIAGCYYFVPPWADYPGDVFI
jgi:Dyp-type peroxidase family